MMRAARGGMLVRDAVRHGRLGENSGDIRIYYEDHGAGSPVVLVHGYLADGHSWEKQEAALLAAGYRVITYDRRGGSASSRPAAGYDYDTLAADLNILLEELDLRDAVLAGCGCGTGEVTRYLGTYGQRRVRAAALLAPLPPFQPRSAANLDGSGRGFLDEFPGQLTADRPAAVKTYLDRYYNIDLLGGSRVSDQAWHNSFYTAISVSRLRRTRRRGRRRTARRSGPAGRVGTARRR